MKIFLIFTLFAYASGFHFECNFGYEDFGDVFGQLYTCTAGHVDYTDNLTHVIDYSGTHMEGHTSQDVKGIFFMCGNFYLRTVPQGILRFFPNLSSMSFWFCPMQELAGNELIGYPNLQGFGIALSDFNRIPGNLFQPTPNLKVASFVENKITRVGFGLLDNLLHLQEAYFEQNICIDKNALSASKIPALIQTLRSNCTDFFNVRNRI